MKKETLDRAIKIKRELEEVENLRRITYIPYPQIVNSSNKYMICGSGVCGAIYKKANKELLEDYCKKHYKENMGTYEIRFSPGFDLEIDILHIYCPKYYDYKDHNEAIEDLLFCYYKIICVVCNKIIRIMFSSI